MNSNLLKSFVLLSFLSLFILPLWAETPNKMSYQAIIRNSSQELVAEKTIKMCISILQGSITENAVFTETHMAETNINGIVAIEIGGGEAVSGNIATIDWSAGPYFIKTETDIAGGDNYTLVNTSQLLSVPYALHAKTAETVLAGTSMTAIPVLTNEEIGSLTPGRGQMVLNITDDMLMIYSGSKWMPSSGGCWPQPNKANAGSSQTLVDGRTIHTYLTANKPDYGCTGKWSVVSGEGGVFEDDTNPSTKFSGSLCTNYTLRWTIESPCSSSSSNVNIHFTHTPTQANAGSNQTYTDGTTTVTLVANTPEEGTGKWSVVSGEGGVFEDDTNPSTKFSGSLCTNYTLRWTIESPCSSSSSNVNIHFTHTPTQANAGSNQTYTDGTTTVTLVANTPEEGTGKWSIVSGEEGRFDNDINPQTTFIGKVNNKYELMWTISTACSSSTSTVQISLFADAMSGNKLTDIDGNTYNTVWIGGRLWIAENLKTTKYNDGTAIPYITDNNQWRNLSTPAYCYYNNDTSNGNTYGALYNWYAVNTGKLCPEGWHVPSDAEWTELENHLADNGYNYDSSIGGEGNKIAKAMASEEGWKNYTGVGTVGNTDYPEYRNKSGFSALPGGDRDGNGAFNDIGDGGSWWSSTGLGTGRAYYRYLGYGNSYIYRDYNNKQIGFSVRCVRD